jgi:hypothetical protein
VVEYTDENLRGSRFRRVDLSGSHLHGVVMHDVRITDAWLHRVEISAEIDRVVINGVDVSDFVAEELDRRYPERRLLTATDADGLRAAWALIEETAEATVTRAQQLPKSALDESVDGEFTFLQTLRHLVFATDRWITGPVFDDPQRFHPLGYPHDDPESGRALGLDIDATPSLDEVLALRRDRLARVAELLRTASDEDLQRTVESPNGGTTTVMGCVHVVLNEEWWHNRYATRDLDALANATPG